MSILSALISSYARAPHQVFRNIRWWLPNTISQQSVVFVVGAPRSGTTLLQRVLASHSALFSMDGETGVFSARNIFARDHFELSHEENLRLFAESKDIVDFFTRGIAILEEANGSGTFVEKTPQHVRRLRFLTQHFPASKFIHIVRDGRDCFCSSRGHPNIQIRSAVAFARYWRNCIRSSQEVDADAPVLTIRYEDFTAAPEDGTDRIMKHLGLDFEPGQLDLARTGSDNRATLKHFKRIATPISSTTVGRWRTEMTAAEVAAFERVAAEELVLHGYELQSKSRAKRHIRQSDAAHCAAPAMDSKTGPVLVAGRQFSGNTMLTVLLGRIPGWYGQSDESTLLEMHGLFDSMSDIEARSAALVKAIGLEDPEQAQWLDDFVRRRWRDDNPPSSLTLWREAMDGLTARRGDTRWAQKGTSYIFYASEILDAWPDVRMIYMLRNPWDLVASRRKRNPKVEAVLSTVLSWVKGARLAQTLQQKHPDRFRIVQYETITMTVLRPSEHCDEWLQTPYNDDYLNVPHVNPSENPYTLDNDERQHGLNTSRVYQYVHRLKPHEIAAVDMALGLLSARALVAKAYPELPHEPGHAGLVSKLRGALGLSVSPPRAAWTYLRFSFLNRSPRHIIARTWRRLRG